VRVLVIALAALAAAPLTAEARTVTERDSADGTRAELRYERTGSDLAPDYRNFRLRIWEGKDLVVDHPLANCGKSCRRYAPAGFGRSRSIHVRDLDGGKPEVVVNLYTGGSYCCWMTTAYRARQGTYFGTAQNWGPKRPRMEDAGGNALPEFLSFDDSFLGPYGCATCWRYLPHVWRFDSGKFRDVTKRFPDRVRQGSKALKRKYRRASGKKNGNVKPWLAAYVATTYLLGEPRRGWKVVNRALRQGKLDNRRGRYDFCPCGRGYRKALKKHLRKYGYR